MVPDEQARDGSLQRVPGHPGWASAILPSISVQCHAANLMPLGNGDLGCVWFGGTQEGMSDISIHFARLPSGRATWSAPVRLIDDPTRSEQNPILFPAPDGRLLLLYTSQRSGDQDTAIVRHRTSRDHGVTWSPPETLIATPGTFVRQPIHVRADGAWLLPVFHCRTEAGVPWSGHLDSSSVQISQDNGHTWTLRPVPDSTGAVHMTILAPTANTLVALYRSRWADHIYRSTTSDGGETWSQPRPLDLPNNNASIQATVLRDGRIALVYNASSAANATGRRSSLYDDLPDSREAGTPGNDSASKPTASLGRTAFWGAPRAPLCLALSADQGETWSAPMKLATSDGYCMTNNSRERLNRELSYPSIVETPDRRIHIAYTHFRQAIRHIVLEPAALTDL